MLFLNKIYLKFKKIFVIDCEKTVELLYNQMGKSYCLINSCGAEKENSAP